MSRRYNDPPNKVGPLLYDEEGNLAIDLAERKFYGPNGTTVTGSWSSPLGGEGGIVDGQQLFDDAHVLSLDAAERKLYATDGSTIAISYNGPNIEVFTANGTGNHDDGVALSAGGLFVDNIADNWNATQNIDLLNRKLYGVDGTTEMFRWDTIDGAGPTNVYLDGTARAAVQILGSEAAFIVGDRSTRGATLGVDGLTNWYGDANPNIDLLNRKLYNPDGTTVAINYGTNDSVFIFGNNIEFDSDGGFFLPNFSVTPSGTVAATEFNTLNNMIRFEESGTVILGNLPSSDPHITGQLWNSGGNVKVSAG